MSKSALGAAGEGFGAFFGSLLQIKDREDKQRQQETMLDHKYQYDSKLQEQAHENAFERQDDEHIARAAAAREVLEGEIAKEGRERADAAIAGAVRTAIFTGADGKPVSFMSGGTIHDKEFEGKVAEVLSRPEFKGKSNKQVVSMIEKLKTSMTTQQYNKMVGKRYASQDEKDKAKAKLDADRLLEEKKQNEITNQLNNRKVNVQILKELRESSNQDASYRSSRGTRLADSWKDQYAKWDNARKLKAKGKAPKILVDLYGKEIVTTASDIRDIYPDLITPEIQKSIDAMNSGGFFSWLSKGKDTRKAFGDVIAVMKQAEKRMRGGEYGGASFSVSTPTGSEEYADDLKAQIVPPTPATKPPVPTSN